MSGCRPGNTGVSPELLNDEWRTTRHGLKAISRGGQERDHPELLNDEWRTTRHGLKAISRGGQERDQGR
jgi:ketosteroid isomerase-like protein